MALTKRQRQVYDFIAEFVQSNGYSPSFEESVRGWVSVRLRPYTSTLTS